MTDLYSDRPPQGHLRWDNALGMLPTAIRSEPGPQGALVPDSLRDSDKIAVIYDKGQTPPEITIRRDSGSVHTVLADGIAVAIVASANGPAPSKDDVLLVERAV
ncbi:hypothetical protein FIU94_15480 [Sulfitobacter sp. THAF37]|uniref:hypothetical protein n=1 Tax=Sulfitobacter sp. THAF37 TaxID=2587855 RepID=UPI0012694E7F|nr:hypothetical protein [Sulfitobacter sp. THAF37]QFT60228.1 hypothetical protein FIU94_15480 [Sulfitobacter sp. THAF37]